MPKPTAGLLALAVTLLVAGASQPSAAHATFTAGTGAATVREAESAVISSSSAGQVYTDSAASAQRAVLLWSTGSISTALGAPLGLAAGEVRVRARGDQCAGAPQMTVLVDGVVVGHSAVGSTTWATYSYVGAWASGSHNVTISYTNDYVTTSCDRNLRLDKVAVVSAGLPSPPPASRTFGLSSDGPNRGLPTAVSTMASLGRKLQVFNTYEDWGWQGPLPVADMRSIAATGATPEITWEAWHPGGGVNQADYTLASIGGGAHDAYIISWARAAASYGQPLMLRFGHEMNGDWYPWSASVNGNSPAGYIAAFRHIHDLFAAAGARNVKWVWSPNVQEGMRTALPSVWPGSAYVDVIGVDGYNGGSDAPYMGGWKSPQQVFDATLASVRALAPGVPVILNEVGCAEHGGDKPAWIAQLFEYLKTTPVSGVLWFDEHGSPADWALRSSAGSMSAAATALALW